MTLYRFPEPPASFDKPVKDYIYALLRVLKLNSDSLQTIDGTFLPIGTTTDGIPEGIVNLYFTDVRAQNAARADLTNPFLLMGG